MKTNALRSADLFGEAKAQFAVGDVVQTSANLHPQYQVIAVAADRAWLRDTQHGSDHIVPIDRCRKIRDHGA